MSPGLPPAPSSTPSAAFWGGKKPKSGSWRCGGALSSPRSPLGCPCVPPPQLSEGRDALKKTWNPKFTLRSHYDAVRGLAFHPAEAALLTASEDSTLKLWNLQKTVAAKKWVLGIPGGGGWCPPTPSRCGRAPLFVLFIIFLVFSLPQERGAGRGAGLRLPRAQVGVGGTPRRLGPPGASFGVHHDPVSPRPVPVGARCWPWPWAVTARCAAAAA